MYNHLYPVREDIPSVRSGDDYFTPQLMHMVNNMNVVDVRRRQIMQQYSKTPVKQFILQKQLELTSDLLTTIKKELINETDALSETIQEEVNEYEESSALVGQKGSDDESSEGGNASDDI